MKNKICVYGICKNELDHLDTWLNSVSEADYVVILDTGSTDGSYEYLKNDPRCTVVEQKEIKPWRFDVARNESMKLVPDDADILLCLDQDEIITPGWANLIKSNWKEKYTRGHYTYAWSHNDLGEAQDVFIYDKLHTKDYHWVFPVHEVLMPIKDDFVEEVLDFGELIRVDHYQDLTKARSSYFDLLKVSVEENPEDSHCYMLLAREYLLRREYNEALEHYLKCLEMPDVDKKKLIRIECLGRVGDLYSLRGDYDKAIHYYNEFIKCDSTYREPYFCLAEIYNAQGLYVLAESIMKTAFEVCTRKFDWVERRDNWIAHGEDILSISEFYLGKVDDAIKHCQIAVKHNPNDVRILKNYIAFLENKYIPE